MICMQIITQYGNPLWKCPQCKNEVKLEPHDYGYHITCRNCYDVDFVGGEDDKYVGNQFSVHGFKKQDAIDQWADFVDDYLYEEDDGQ